MPTTCRLDYTRGGGSSGSRVRDGGAATDKTGRSDGSREVGAFGLETVANKLPGQNAMAWQPRGLVCGPHGPCCDPVASFTAAVSWAVGAPRSVWAVPEAAIAIARPVPDIGMGHNSLPPASQS